MNSEGIQWHEEPPTNRERRKQYLRLDRREFITAGLSLASSSMPGQTWFLNRRLKLEINKDKSRVAKTNDTNFLGFTFKGSKIWWSDKAFRQFKWRIKRLTGRSWFVAMQQFRMIKIARYLRSWGRKTPGYPIGTVHRSALPKCQ
jgi:hypothetical protein